MGRTNKMLWWQGSDRLPKRDTARLGAVVYLSGLLLAALCAPMHAGTLASLSLSMSDSDDPVTAGETLTYTLQVSNVGATADNVVVTETLPAGVTFVSTSGCAEDPVGYPDCSLGSLPSESIAEYTITVLVDPSTTGMLSNSALVTSTTPELNPGDEMATEMTGVVTAADLSLNKVGSVDPVVAGENLTYTLTVINNGPSDALDVMVDDVLGGGVTVVSTSGCAEDPGGVPDCTLGTVAAGGSAQYTITVAVDPSFNDSVNNSATVSSSTTEDSPGDETAFLATGVIAVSELSLSKTDSVDPVDAGSNLTYTLTVDNAGPSDANFVEIADTLPVGVTFVSSSGCLEEDESPPGVHFCLLDGVPAGGSSQYTITVAVNLSAPSLLTNNAEVVSPDPGGDPFASESTAVITAADLSLTKSDSEDPVAPGANLTYTLTVSNSGPSEALNVVVADTLPSGVTLVSTSGCAQDPNGAPTCSLGNIAANGSAQYTLTVAVDSNASGTLVNTAQVSSDSQEVAPGDEEAVESTAVVPQADLGLQIEDQPDPVQVGSQLTYTFTVNNAGPSPSSASTLNATLDGGTSFVSSSQPCTVQNGAVSCGLGSLAVDASTNVEIVVEIPPDTVGSVSLQALVLGAESDLEEGNNQAGVTTQVDSSTDLVLSLESSPAPASLGEPLTLRAEVENLGPATATEVRLLWRLPDGISLESSDVFPRGTCVESSGLTSCALGNIRVGETFGVELSVSVSRSGILLSDATLLAANPDPDPEGSNQRLVIQVGAAADLQALKETDSETVSAASPLVYRLTVLNNGPSPATAITLEDTLPAGVAIDAGDLPEGCATAEPDGGGEPTVVCQIDELEAGSQIVILLPVTLSPDLRGAFSNQVVVQSDTADPDDSNNTASVTNQAVGSGDLNGDGEVNALDLSVLVREINDGDGNQVEDVAGGDFEGNAAFDVNGDGFVDEADLEALVTLVLRK